MNTESISSKISEVKDGPLINVPGTALHNYSYADNAYWKTLFITAEVHLDSLDNG